MNSPTSRWAIHIQKHLQERNKSPVDLPKKVAMSMAFLTTSRLETTWQEPIQERAEKPPHNNVFFSNVVKPLNSTPWNRNYKSR